LPEHQQQDKACDQYIGAAFQQRLNDSGPAPFEPWTGHNDLLKGKETEQQSVCYKSPGERIARSSVAMVYRPRDYLMKVAYKRDGIDESPECDEVAGNAVDKSKNST
jgi:hypothetical protein